MDKGFKIALIVAGALFVIIFITLIIFISKKNKKIKQLENDIKVNDMERKKCKGNVYTTTDAQGNVYYECQPTP